MWGRYDLRYLREGITYRAGCIIGGALNTAGREDLPAAGGVIARQKSNLALGQPF